MTPTTTAGTGALAAYRAELERRLAGRGPGWLDDLRRDGWSRFDATGLPTPDLENWKNTNVTALSTTTFVPPADDPRARPALSALAGLRLGSTRLTFVDGRYAASQSERGRLPEGVFAGSLQEALREIPERLREHLLARPEGEAEFRALNDALLVDGAVIVIPDGVAVDEPLQLVFAASGAATACHPRTLILAGKGSRATVVEVHCGAAGAYLVNTVGDVSVGDGAQLDHVRIQEDSEAAWHISTRHSRQGRDSSLRTFGFDFGGKLVRHNLRAVLDGEGGHCEMYGLYLTHGTQHVDSHTTLDHARPHCDSRELYKGVLDGSSRSVFSGRIIVREDAQKTDAKQSNPNLLLSDRALAHTRPQLEIYADDVKCTHGATMGRLDEDSIFYLRSRGIGRAEARRMMVEAFALEVVEPVRNDALRDALSREVARRLDRR